MAEPLTIYKGATGLNTVADPIRLPFDGETFLSALALAVNIEIDPTFRVSRRKDTTILFNGNFHSVYCDRGECLVISDATMYKVSNDLQSITVVVAGLIPNFKMSYAQHGKRIYFNNEHNKGYVEDGTFTQLVTGTYNGPDTNKVFGIPKNGRHIGIFSGRMLMAVGPQLYWSEPHQFNLYNLGDSHITLDSDIRMVKPVDEGVFVSSGTRVYFLQGEDPKKWKIRIRTGYPAIEYSSPIEYVEGLEIGLQNSGLCALWASPEGAILGTPSGQILNLTKHSVIYPEDASIGAGCLIGYNFLHRMV